MYRKLTVRSIDQNLSLTGERGLKGLGLQSGDAIGGSDGLHRCMNLRW